MQTIQITVEDELYQKLFFKEINIEQKIREFLFNLVDDGYPTISENEAKTRVSKAVNRYKNGTGIYLNATQYQNRMDNFMAGLKNSANN